MDPTTTAKRPRPPVGRSPPAPPNTAENRGLAGSGEPPALRSPLRQERNLITTNRSVSPLAAALNDNTRVRIGNPRRGTFAISIATAETRQAMDLAAQLDRLEVDYQTNFRRDAHGSPHTAFLTIYELDSQRRLLDALGDDLSAERYATLELLVRARGSVPQRLLRRIDATVALGKSYGYIAERMNHERHIDGMGRGWTTKKLRQLHRTYLEDRDREEAPRREGRA